MENAEFIATTSGITPQLSTIGVKVKISDKTTIFTPTLKKFSLTISNYEFDYVGDVYRHTIEDQVNVVGIVARVENVCILTNEKLNLTTLRRIIFITDGTCVLPIYIYGELAYKNFEVKQLVGVKYGLVNQHTACDKIVSCNRSSYIIDVDNEAFIDLLLKSRQIEYESLTFP
uniref:CheW-like domain-containing protein n=1 Tax=Strongyloides papillosus TaxID=174720 RepID=A0A0N5BMH0_STREA